MAASVCTVRTKGVWTDPAWPRIWLATAHGNFSYSAATVQRMHQVGASAFDQITERTVRGVEPLRITTGRGMPLQLSTQGARMNARLSARNESASGVGGWVAEADHFPPRMTPSWSEPSGVAQLAEPHSPTTLTNCPTPYYQIDGGCAQGGWDAGFPPSSADADEDDECIKLVSEDAPLPEELPATEWNSWLKDTDGKQMLGLPPVIRLHAKRVIQSYPLLMEGFDVDSFNR